MRSLKLSFAGGEISPEMVGRLDSRQYQSGAAKVLNYLPLPQGPVTRRPGSRYVADEYNNSEAFLIPFVYSTDQALVIEMRRGMFRFFTDGEQLLYATPRDMGESGWDTAANTATFIAEHGFLEDVAIQFTVPDGDALPSGLALGTTYYANIVDSYTIQIGASAPAASSLISLSGSPTGYARAFLKDDHPVDWVGGADYVQGDLVYWFGGGSQPDGVYYCKVDHTADAGGQMFNDTANWWGQLNDGQLTINSPYTEAALPSMHYAQSNDVVTIVHPDFRPRELRRLGAKNWDLRAITFGSALSVPTTVVATEDRGASFPIDSATASTPGTRFNTLVDHNLASGDSVWALVAVGAGGLNASGYYQVAQTNGNKEFWLKTTGGLAVSGTPYTPIAIAIYYASLSAENTQSYKVTAVDANDIETTASTAGDATNNLDVAGASNVISWAAVPNAQKYRVYREQNGLYGYIGESETTGFTDDGIDVDLGRTPPIADDDLSGTDYPRAVGYHQQRRVFASTTLKPNHYWMTKSGTESDLTYSLPVRDDDRVSAGIAARDGIVIRHIVPVRRGMVMLTQQSEWLVDGGEAGAVTPDTVSNESLEDNGASDVRPLKVGGTIVFPAARGGHIYAMGYSLQAQGLTVNDVSLRATHLFDGKTILDSTHSKAPYPVLWFVSSSGKLLSLTYMPREEVAGWASHDLGTAATVESVCSIPEGDQDSVYMVVKRTVNGTTARYIERLVPQVTESLTDSVYLDSSVTFDGSETDGRSIALGGTQWGKGKTLTITASSPLFKAGDVGDEVEITAGWGGKYRVKISGYTSSTVVTGEALQDVPTALRRTSVTNWAFARKVIGGLTHLEAETVSIVADGVVLEDQVVAGGSITLPVAAAKAHVGRNFTSEVQTLPIALQQVDGAGQGRSKNVATAHLRVLESAGMKVGPDADNLTPIEGMTATKLTTGEQRAVPRGAWTQGAEFLIRQDQPLPSTVLGLTLDVELGG